MTNMVSGHKVFRIVFRIDVSQATSSRVLFIGVSRDTSMSETLYVRELHFFHILEVVP